MASAVIHIAVAQKINEKLKRDKSKILIGSVAPDISKLIGETKNKSHFLDNKENNIPNLDKFLQKYKKNLNDDFVLGYYIHLYTDYLWFKYFMTEILHKNSLTKLDGTVVEADEKTIVKYIYNDYSNLNKQLIEEYNLDLEMFYSKLPPIDKIIEEIPTEKLDIVIKKMLFIIENSKNKKNIVFDIKNAEQFINLSSELILLHLKTIYMLNNYTK